MDNLKPCPFCGQMPKIDTSQWKHFEHQREPLEVIEQRVTITCDRCFLEMDIVARSYATIGLEEKEYRSVSKAAARNVLANVWNRRTADG